MPSQFNVYKKMVRYSLIKGHGWTGKDATAAMHMWYSYIRGRFDKGVPQFQTATNIHNMKRGKK